jgi:hypothetical protein
MAESNKVERDARQKRTGNKKRVDKQKSEKMSEEKVEGGGDSFYLPT